METTSGSPDQAPDKSKGPTRKDLDAIIARFQLLNNQRMQRMLDTLPARQGEFLHLLPLLFHYHHPHLPGYVSGNIPHGIAGYLPGAETKKFAARLVRNFAFRAPIVRRFPILGLYIMGSVGTVAYSKASDLDIWLCHAPQMAVEELDALALKTKAVELWAASLDLEVHFFFINADQFRSGIGCPISKESTGSIQHHLLLEEFYRSALYVAGYPPLWWLVPPNYEHAYSRYIAMLKDKGLVNEAEYLDFGGLESMPAGEFLAATLWHLYKAIASPHKSLLKLLLMESYASEYPGVEWVSTQMKRAVYGGLVDAGSLDPYILMYRKVEQYLQAQGEQERLELARQSFYLKANESMSQDSAAKLSQQRRSILRGLIQGWGWENAQLTLLDTRRRRLLLSMIEERKEIVRGLRGCYGAIRKFANEHVQTTSFEDQEVVLIGRMLFAALEKKPGKVDIFAVDQEKGVEEQEFSLLEVRLADEAYGWCLYIGRIRAVEARGKEPVKKARCLLEILAWMAANGLYNVRTYFAVETIRSALPPNDLGRLMKLLGKFLEQNVPEGDSLDVYLGPSKTQHVSLFLNVGQEAAVTRSATQAAYTNRNDPFCYGINQSSLVITTERVSLTSWREVMVHKYEGLRGLIECLCDTYNQAGHIRAKPTLQAHCLIPTRGEIIARRVQQLYDDLGQVFSATHHQPRYVVRGERCFYVFSWRDGVLRFDNASSLEKLLLEMSQPVSDYSPVLFDPNALDASPLPVICDHNREGVVQVFAVPDKQSIDVYILDERGSLYFRRHVSVQIQQVLNPYASFLEAVQQRYAMTGGFTVDYYWVAKESSNDYLAEKINFAARQISAKIDIRVIGQEMAPGRVAYTIYTDDKEFSSMEDGRELFTRAADYVYQRRLSGERYPIYVSDIDVPPSALGIGSQAQLQTVYFLKYKDKIEAMLNSGGDAAG